MSAYVVFVEANVKGGVRVNLGPKTFIFGPNGSGKGAVQNSVELALTGKVTDVQGRRELARETDLIAHLTPDRKGELFARAVLSDGSECLWRAGAKGKKSATHSHPPQVVPDLVLPLRPVYGAVMGAVETARKFFLEHAVGNVSDKDVLAHIPAALHPYYGRATMATTLSTDTAVDRLLAAMERSKKSAREASDRAKAAEKITADSAQGLSPLPTEQDEKALTQAVKEAEGRLDAAKRMVAQGEALAGMGERLTAARARRDAAVERANATMEAWRAASAALAALPPPALLDRNVASILGALKAQVAAPDVPFCMVCGNPHPTESFAARLGRAEAYLATQLEGGRVYEAAARRAADAEVAATAAHQAMGEANAALAALTQSASPVAEAPPTPEYVAGCEAALAQLRERQRANDVLKASWAVATRSRDSVQQALDEAGEWKKLHDACAEAIVRLLDHGVAGFTAKVQHFLPAGDRFNITLREGERQVFQFGLEQNGKLRTALSGAEWARVTAALAAACTPPAPKVAVVIPEDRSFDPHTLLGVLEAFAHMEAQVILASPIVPAGSIPAGWTVIDTTSDAHRTGVPPGAEDGRMMEAPAVPLYR